MDRYLKGAVWCVGVLMTAVFVSGLHADPLPVPLVHWTFDGGAATNCGSGGSLYDADVSGAVAPPTALPGAGFVCLAAARGMRRCLMPSAIRAPSRFGTNRPDFIITTLSSITS